MKKRLYLFVTPDGLTYSSPDLIEPDVDNYQVLGYGEGLTEEEAFKDFLANNRWLENTKFKEVIGLEIKQRIHEGKAFCLKQASIECSERIEN